MQVFIATHAIKFLAHRFSNSCPQVASLWALQQINAGNSAVKAEFCLLEITWLLTKLKENGILMWLVTLNHRRHSICNGQVRFTVLNQVIPWKHLSLKPHLFTILKIKFSLFITNSYIFLCSSEDTGFFSVAKWSQREISTSTGV